MAGTSRRTGQLDLDVTIEVSRNLPLDARNLVRTKEELLDPDSFQYGYDGLLVSCRDDKRLFMLEDKNNTSAEESWTEYASVKYVNAQFSKMQFADESDIDDIVFGVTP